MTVKCPTKVSVAIPLISASSSLYRTWRTRRKSTSSSMVSGSPIEESPEPGRQKMGVDETRGYEVVDRRDQTLEVRFYGVPLH